MLASHQVTRKVTITEPAAVGSCLPISVRQLLTDGQRVGASGISFSLGFSLFLSYCEDALILVLDTAFSSSISHEKLCGFIRIFSCFLDAALISSPWTSD